MLSRIKIRTVVSTSKMICVRGAFIKIWTNLGIVPTCAPPPVNLGILTCYFWNEKKNILCIYYDQALRILELDNLEERRNDMCLKFAKKCVKNTKFSHWFPKIASPNTRSKVMYIQPSGKTKRYLTSSIPHLIQILNENEKSQKIW